MNPRFCEGAEFLFDELELFIDENLDEFERLEDKECEIVFRYCII